MLLSKKRAVLKPTDRYSFGLYIPSSNYLLKQMPMKFRATTEMDCAALAFLFELMKLADNDWDGSCVRNEPATFRDCRRAVGALVRAIAAKI